MIVDDVNSISLHCLQFLKSQTKAYRTYRHINLHFGDPLGVSAWLLPKSRTVISLISNFTMAGLDTIEHETPSPASKAFSERLSKYAYMSTTPSPSKSRSKPEPTQAVRSNRSSISTLASTSASAPISAQPSRDQISSPRLRSSPRTRRRLVNTIHVIDALESESGSDPDQGDDDQYIDDGSTRFAGDDGGFDVRSSTRKRPRESTTLIPIAEERSSTTTSIKVENHTPKVKAKYLKKPRGFASPEVYQHLRPINDLLKSNLDSGWFMNLSSINVGERILTKKSSRVLWDQVSGVFSKHRS